MTSFLSTLFSGGRGCGAVAARTRGRTLKGGIDLAFAQRDETGQVVAAEKKIVELDFLDPQYQALLGTGAIFERHLELNAAAMDVRTMVDSERSGQIGTETVPMKTSFPDSDSSAIGQTKPK